MVAKWLKDYPRYPAILVAKASPLNNPLKPCGQAEIPLTLENKGQGRAVGVTIGIDGGKHVLAEPVNVGYLEPGEKKSVNIPIKTAAGAVSGVERLTMQIREQLGNDAAPIVVEVPLSGARPEIELRNVAFNDGATSQAVGNANGRIENGEGFEVSAEVVNRGKERAREVALTLASADARIKKEQALIHDLAPGESRTVRFGAGLDTCFAKSEARFQLSAAQPDTCFEPVQLAKNFPVQQSFPRFRPELLVHDGNRPGTRGNRNGRIDAGERVEVAVKLANEGGAPAANTTLKIGSKDIRFPEVVRSLGDIASGAAGQASFSIDIPRLYSGENLGLTVAISSDNSCGGSQDENLTLTVGKQVPKLVVEYKIADTGANGNGNGILEQGEECQVYVTVRNDGGLDAENVQVDLVSPIDDITIPEWRKSLGTIPAGGEPVVFSSSVFIKRRCAPKEYPLALKVAQSDFTGLDRKLPMLVAKAGESAIVTAAVATTAQAVPALVSAAAIETPPVIIVTDPVKNATFNTPEIDLIASVLAKQGLRSFTVSVSGGQERGIGLRSQLENRQVIREKVRLAEGDNEIMLMATDLAGVTTTETLRVRYEPAADFYGDLHAVIVGIDDYKDKRIPGLRYAVADAHSLKQTLIRSAGFRAENIIELYNEEATKDEIIYQIKDNLRERVKPNDGVLFFFAGHGETIGNSNEAGILLAYNTRQDRLGSTGIPITEIEEASRILGSRHNLFILDSCFSGMAGYKTRSTVEQDKDAGLYIRKMMQKRGSQVITAGMRDEKVLESDLWKHSVFTYYLLKGLEGGADMDANGLISTSELAAFLQPKVTTESKGKQTPQLRFLGDEGEFMFRRASAN